MKELIQRNWHISCTEIKKITDTAWDIDDSYVLKKYDRENELRRNIILMEHLGERQIPTGQIIESIAGLKYVEREGRYFLLTRKLRGKEVLQIKEFPGLARQMGRIIGKLQDALIDCQDEIDVWESSLLEELQGWIRDALMKDCWQMISQEDFENTCSHLEGLYAGLPKQLIHRDVHFGNFLFDQGEFSGYIDFDLSQRNIRIFDLCYFLLGLQSEEESRMPWEDWLQVVEDVKDGYGEVIEMTPEEERAIPYVMQGIELLFVAFFLNEGDGTNAAGARDLYIWLREGMNHVQIKTIVAHPELVDAAAGWFHEKWGIPLEAYRESMEECLSGQSSVPQWYVALDGNRIIAGLGVIENDFHERKDLAPNVCAVYVEEEYRCQGIAGELLQYACKDMEERGIGTLYLVTGHTSFYERYGWKFLCMVRCDGEEGLSRMYIHGV